MDFLIFKIYDGWCVTVHETKVFGRRKLVEEYLQGGTGIGKKYIAFILAVNEAGNSISEGSEAVG